VESVRAVGNLANLRQAVQMAEDRSASRPLSSGEGGDVAAGSAVLERKGSVLEAATTGIAHTRWATHGRVTEANAHPHTDSSGSTHIVLNGIVENHAELRRSLEAGGSVFSSETDAETVAHLIEHHYAGDLVAAV